MRPLVLAAALALAACAGAAPPADHYWRLNSAPPGKAAARPLLPGVVEVTRFTADGLASQRGIVYVRRDDPLAVQNYNYHFWSDLPTSLLQDQMVRYLRATGVADTVVTSDLRAVPDWVVQGRIKRFEHVVGTNPAVVAEIELGVTPRSVDRVVLLNTYTVERPAGDGSVEAAVQALDQAVAEVFERFIADLKDKAPRA